MFRYGFVSADLSTWLFCRGHLGLAAWCGFSTLLKTLWRPLDVCSWLVVSKMGCCLLDITQYPFFFHISYNIKCSKFFSNLTKCSSDHLTCSYNHIRCFSYLLKYSSNPIVSSNSLVTL